jgi:hypothetical protein
MGNRWQFLRGFPWRILGLGQPVGLPCGADTSFESVIYFSGCYVKNYVMYVHGDDTFVNLSAYVCDYS